MSGETKKLTRRRLEKLPRESIHRARNWSKADVFSAQWPPDSGRSVIIKDLKPRSLWFRVLFGRALLRREWKALCALRDLKGIPLPIARPDADCLVMEKCEGRQIETMPPGEMPRGVVSQLEGLLNTMHARGVTHGDLHGYNILVDEAGNVSLIDWATACAFDARPRGVKKVTFEEWRALDERALAKIKIAHEPAGITSRQRELLLQGGSRMYRLVKKFKVLKEKIRPISGQQKAERDAKQERFERLLDEYYRPAARSAK